MAEQSKTAIILVGDGMKSGHGSGFLYALATEIGITAPDIMVASSGDAANMAYFVAGQWEENRRMVLNLLSTPKFISFWRFWKIMDIDYLVDVVYKHQAPIDVEKVAASTIRWRIPIRDIDTGELRYVGAGNHLDLFEVLRAAKAIPFLYWRKVRIEDHRYVDGQYGTKLDEHIAQARSLGAQRIVIVNHWQSTSTFSDPNIIFVSPSSPLPCGIATRDNKKLRATFDRGVADARALKDELSALFAKV
jgi:predicted patatin/cPLA2 family phospholipase